MSINISNKKYAILEEPIIRTKDTVLSENSLETRSALTRINVTCGTRKTLAEPLEFQDSLIRRWNKGSQRGTLQSGPRSPSWPTACNVTIGTSCF